MLNAEHAQTGKGGKTWGIMDMRRALRDRLANYKIPQEMKVMKDGLPRNAMGKSQSHLCLDAPSGEVLTYFQ